MKYLETQMSPVLYPRSPNEQGHSKSGSPSRKRRRVSQSIERPVHQQQPSRQPQLQLQQPTQFTQFMPPVTQAIVHGHQQISSPPTIYLRPNQTPSSLNIRYSTILFNINPIFQKTVW